MLKRERHLKELKQYTLADKTLESYLLQNSNLPGRRANLELAFAFGDYIADQCHDSVVECFEYCLGLIIENPTDKNESGQEEFLPFCAIIGLGRIGKIDVMKNKPILELMRTYAKDSRWRIREAVAMAIQTIMEINPGETVGYLRSWLTEENYLVHRALVAGLANPELLKKSDFARKALAIHKSVIENVERETSVRDNDFKVLVKGLCYTLSVVVAGIEKEGFAYLEELTHSTNPVIKRIVRENLRKNRLIRLNEEKVLELQEELKQTH